MSTLRKRTGADRTSQGHRCLSRHGFAAELEACSRTLWCIAAAVLGNREHVNDVLQEAAMIAMAKLSQFDADTNFRAWMARIVRNVALNHARQLRRTTVSVDPRTLESVIADNGQGRPAPVSGRGELLATEDFDDRVLAGLQTLDETARACLLLRTVLDMPYREIALALDIPQGTAMSHVHRARRELRQRLFELRPIPSQDGGVR